MHLQDRPVHTDIVLLGGGHAHAGVLRAFAMQPEPGVRITLVNRDMHTPYSGMLPGLVAGHYSFDETHIDLYKLSAFAAARFIHAEAMGIDPAKNHVTFKDRPPLPFDILSVDIGSSPAASHIPGAGEFATGVKPISAFLSRWNALVERVTSKDQPLSIMVVGAGAAGVETLLAMQLRLTQLRREAGRQSALQFHLVSGSPEILPAFPARVRNIFEAIFKQRGVKIHRDCMVTSVDKGGVQTHKGHISADEIIWVTAAAPAPWLKETALALDAGGFIAVDDTLRSISHKNIFAAGDIASMANHPRPKAGVFAVRQTKSLIENLRRAARGADLIAFHPQREFLTLISTGGKHAVAVRNGFALQGDWVWRWKDQIDRKFMTMFNNLPVRNSSHDQHMRCAGCGAKVNGAGLQGMLDRLHPQGTAPRDDAAVIDRGDHVELHTADFFPAPVSDPYVFGKIAARHALGDIEAMGGAAQTALAIATVPYAQGSKMSETLEQMMAGAIEILSSEGVKLIGGHSGEGEQLALGFSIAGRAGNDHLTLKAGMQKGDVLVLTKPLGSGVLLAAGMRAQAKGRWIEKLTSSMLQSNITAAGVLIDHGARAMTDITGFGLAGHLAEMLRASHCSAQIELNALPLFEGAAECFAMGLRSTAHEGNAGYVNDVMDDANSFPALLDPQTAGGLLASVPAETAAAAVKGLHDAGYVSSAIIGRILMAEGKPSLIVW